VTETAARVGKVMANWTILTNSEANDYNEWQEDTTGIANSCSCLRQNQWPECQLEQGLQKLQNKAKEIINNGTAGVV